MLRETSQLVQRLGLHATNAGPGIDPCQGIRYYVWQLEIPHAATIYPWWLRGKESACNAGDCQSLGQEDPLEEGVATHSRILSWEIPQTKEPGGLQSMV